MVNVNIQLASLKERVREVGVKMALGAPGREIFKAFMTEATGDRAPVGAGRPGFKSCARRARRQPARLTLSARWDSASGLPPRTAFGACRRPAHAGRSRHGSFCGYRWCRGWVRQSAPSSPTRRWLLSVAKVIEITASSPTSFAEAVKTGISKASETVHGIRSAWVSEEYVVVENNEVTEFRVTMRVSFVLD